MAPGGVVRLQTTCAGVKLPQSWPASCCIAAALASPRRCKARVETPGGMRAMPGGGQQVENGGLGSACTPRTMRDAYNAKAIPLFNNNFVCVLTCLASARFSYW